MPALALLLRLLIYVELAFDTVHRTVEEIDGRPEQVVKIWFETRVIQCRD
ncbi:hypothetical protein ACVWXO_006321 [Bradyrhizobium sp. LM2.7]